MKKSSYTIVTSLLLSVSILLVAVTGTMAWFTSNRKVSVEAGSFEVTVPDGQDAELYYHSLNYNSTLKAYSGFEKSSLNNENYKKFSLVDGSNTPSPTTTQYLWPNFQLTYAFVFTPKRTGNYSFSIKSWSSEESKDKFVSDGKGIRLSWAIRMYAYICEDDTTFSKAETYFTDYQKKSFFSSLATDTSDTMIQGRTSDLSYTVNDTSKSVVVYFSVEFSNDSSTYYEKNETTAFWSQSNTASSQSACYENLTFKAEKFEVDIPSDTP